MGKKWNARRPEKRQPITQDGLFGYLSTVSTGFVEGDRKMHASTSFEMTDGRT